MVRQETQQVIDEVKSQIGNVVNGVDDLGMDPTGQESISPILENEFTSGGVVIELPPGDYYVDDEVITYDTSDFALVGTGSSREDVRIFTDESDGFPVLKNNKGSGNMLIENLIFEYDQNDDGSIGFKFTGDDNIVCSEVDWVGYNPTNNNGAVNNIVMHVSSQGGTGYVDDCNRTGPTDIVSHGSQGNDSNEGWMWAGPPHVGMLKVMDCHVENTGTNAMYVRDNTGGYIVENCLFRNNNQTSMRIGGEDIEIRNCTFEIDLNNINNSRNDPSDWINPHAILFETKDRAEPGGLIENCEFKLIESADRDNPFLFFDGSSGDVTVRNCDFEYEDTGSGMIKAQDPTDSRLGSPIGNPAPIRFNGCVFKGSGGSSDGVVLLNNRDESEFDDCCFDMSSNTDVIVFNGGSGYLVKDTNMTVGGTALVSDNGADVSTDNVNQGGSCSFNDVGVDGESPTTEPTPTDPALEERTLRVTSVGSEDPLYYRVVIDGDARKLSGANTYEEINSIGDGKIEIIGIVAMGGYDNFEINGLIKSFEATDSTDINDARVTVDGQRLDIDSLPEITGGVIDVVGTPQFNLEANSGDVTATVRNSYNSRDYVATVLITISVSGEQIQSDEAEFDVPSNTEKEIDYEFNHNVPAGESVEICVSVIRSTLVE